MTEPTILALLKTIGAAVVAGILSLFGYLFRKQDAKMARQDARINSIEINQAVHASKQEDLKDDVGEVKKDVHELRREQKEGFEKILNKIEKLNNYYNKNK